MRSAHAELEEAFEAGDMVTVCWEPGCRMHRLYYWHQHEWVEHDRRDGYPNYTHSVCDTHYHAYQDEIQDLTEEEASQPAAVHEVASAA